MKLINLALLIALLNTPMAAMSCGFAKLDVIRPATADAFFSEQDDILPMTLGDWFPLVLPALATNTWWWEQVTPENLVEAFTPADESGPNVYAWRLIQPGSAVIAVLFESQSTHARSAARHCTSEISPFLVEVAASTTLLSLCRMSRTELK